MKRESEKRTPIKSEKRSEKRTPIKSEKMTPINIVNKIVGKQDTHKYHQ